MPVPSGPPLASTATKATGQPVDGIGCDTSEQVLFHIHAHLTVFVNGSPRQVPAGIGIPGAQAQNTPQGPFIGSGKCFYWLHTHAADGIIHTESPVHRTYTLGNFFDEWGQPLGPDQVGPEKGHVTAIYNGKVYQGNPRDIPLTNTPRSSSRSALPWSPRSRSPGRAACNRAKRGPGRRGVPISLADAPGNEAATARGAAAVAAPGAAPPGGPAGGRLRGGDGISRAGVRRPVAR